MKKLLTALLIMAGVGIAQAEVASNLGAVSDYRFRGISQTQNAPAVQGGIDYAHASGFYAGNWNSSVSSQMYTNGAGLESDLYAGYKKEFVGITIDVGSYNYVYARAASADGTKFDTNEAYVGVARGPVSAKISQSLGDYFGIANSRGTRYYQADVAYPVAPKWTVNVHAGRTDVANSAQLAYNDYNIGASYDLSGWAIGVRYYMVSALGSSVLGANTVNGQDLTKNTVVFSASRAFK
jgi:uncharacterized protein (TIGR02001 family)